MSVNAFLERASNYAARINKGNSASGSGSGSGSGSSGGGKSVGQIISLKKGAALVNSAAWIFERFYSVANCLGLSPVLMNTTLMADLSGGELVRCSSPLPAANTP
jgi:hypothetical protein